MSSYGTIDRCFILYRILYQKSSSVHPISIPELISLLEQEGVTVTRQTIYSVLDSIRNAGIPVHRDTQSGGHKGCWLDHSLSSAEAMILMDAVQQSPSLSPSVTKEISGHILSVLSEPERQLIKKGKNSLGKTDNNETLSTIQILLNAIHDLHPVEFYYYDLTVTKQKRYRRNKEKYHLVPYAVLSSNGRYYCVCWSEKYKDFANYRIDKMDHCIMTAEEADPVPFDEESWLRSSFDMYKGEAATIVIEFDLSMVNIVFDQFGKDIIITKVTDKTFTAAIRTAVTPPLVSWLLQFYDRMKVIKPQSLINEFKKIAESLQQTYNEDKKEAE